MNSNDVHERRRAAAAVLKQKFGNAHGFQHHRDYLRPGGGGGSSSSSNGGGGGGGDDCDEDGAEFIDCARQEQRRPVQAAPANRAARYVPICVAAAGGAASGRKSPTADEPSRNSARQKFLAAAAPSQALGPLIESGETCAQAAAAPGPLARAAPHATHASQTHEELHANEEQQVELLDELKRRLSLPSDTSIPSSFLAKHRERLGELKQAPGAPISRRDRRASLLELGFGRASTYTKLHVLGAGTYSIVYKGASRLTSRLLALKEIHLERDEGVPFTALREVSLLKQLRHCNIITLHDIIYASRTLTLVFEYVDRDLGRYMDECDHRIAPANVRLFLFQLLRALAYCHARKVLHRDIKPQNILISARGELKLADFGLARAKSFPTKSYTDEVVTLWYRPPDVLLGNTNYGPCIDMWGVGCIFFEMLAGFTLFLATEPAKQIGCIFEILGAPSERDWPNIGATLANNEIDISAELAARGGRGLSSLAPQLGDRAHAGALNLLERLLRCNPKQRISSAHALRHEYFAPLPREIYDLHDLAPIFSLASVGQLAPEPHRRRHSQSHGSQARPCQPNGDSGSVAKLEPAWSNSKVA